METINETLKNIDGTVINTGKTYPAKLKDLLNS